jgi:hypothetical protein
VSTAEEPVDLKSHSLDAVDLIQEKHEEDFDEGNGSDVSEVSEHSSWLSSENSSSDDDEEDVEVVVSANSADRPKSLSLGRALDKPRRSTRGGGDESDDDVSMNDAWSMACVKQTGIISHFNCRYLPLKAKNWTTYWTPFAVQNKLSRVTTSCCPWCWIGGERTRCFM